MTRLNRRRWLASMTSAPMLLSGAARDNDVRIRSIDHQFADYRYRTPMMFGGRTVDRVTLLHVQITVEGRSGRAATGSGSMTMGNVWSFPSKKMDYQATLSAMKSLAGEVAKLGRQIPDYAHPIELTHHWEPAYLKAAAELSKPLPEPVPKLCSLVTASAFDAALHDAYGRYHQRNTYQLVSADYLRDDLSRYLGSEFKGDRLDRYIHLQPTERLPLFHAVGASDPLTTADAQHRVNDGLPETLPEWIAYNGLRRFKIKLSGNDHRWDVERVAGVHRIASDLLPKRGVNEWFYSFDFNESCPNVEYVLEFNQKLNQAAPAAFHRTQFIEQPTPRTLGDGPEFDIHKAAKLLPVVIDESLTDPETLIKAQSLGYSGAALKACKGISQSMLMAALCQHRRLFLCVQDLTCPGAALVESVGLAAHVPGVAALEANARQYVPAASAGWEKTYPGIFAVKDGFLRCGNLNEAGLSLPDPKPFARA